MPKPIERLRYFDGEFLRGADLQVEQSYHVEMRRRLNLALHLSGVVEGLELAAAEGAEKAGLKLFSVRSGLAIDVFGRELVVLYSQVLDEDLLRLNQATTGNTYSVWLCYRERPLTPPSASLQNCGLSGSDQLTRWREEFQLVLLPKGTPLAPEPENRPRTGMGGIPLGEIIVDASSQVTDCTPQGRTVFAGLHAQRLLHPHVITDDEQNLLKGQFARNDDVPERQWLTVLPDSIFSRNQVIGANFKIQDPDFFKVPAVVPDAGNLKIAGDLFVQGAYYQKDGDSKWRSLDEYLDARIARVVPDVVVGEPKTVAVPPPPPPPPGPPPAIPLPAQLTEQITFTSPVQKATPKISVSISGFQFVALPAAPPAGAAMGIGASIGVIVENPLGTYAIPVTFRFDGLPPTILKSFAYSYVAVLKPPPG